MLHKWLSYLLIVLLAMPSVFAVAEDSHQSHQTGDQHQELTHDHEAAKAQQVEAPLDAFSGDDLDCHHCCHCHHSPHFGLLSESDTTKTRWLNTQATAHQLNYLSERLTPELRPPIA